MAMLRQQHTIEDSLEHAGNAATSMRSHSERFATLASAIHSVAAVPTLRFASELGPGSYEPKI